MAPGIPAIDLFTDAPIGNPRAVRTAILAFRPAARLRFVP